jgi:hypothetical protein
MSWLVLTIPEVSTQAASLLPRLDDTLREVLAAGTRFGACANWKPAGAEVLKTEG